MPTLKHWILATRPKTLPAGIVPVLLGSSIAYADGKLNIFLSGIILIASLLIQIMTNFINEIFDFKKGADTSERKGPKRMVASGIITPSQMKNAVIILAVITVGLGSVIIYKSDSYILLIGVLSLIFTYLYTGGPYPLAYNGLGDLFVLIFFGIIAVCGTYYALTLELTWSVFIASLAPGFLSMNILGVNNYRDIDTDKSVNKNTLQVKIGKKNSLKLYSLLMIMAFLVPIVLFIKDGYYFYLLPLAAVPLAIKLINAVKTRQGIELNEVLAGTGKLVFIHGILSAVGFIMRDIIK